MKNLGMFFTCRKEAPPHGARALRLILCTRPVRGPLGRALGAAAVRRS